MSRYDRYVDDIKRLKGIHPYSKDNPDYENATLEKEIKQKYPQE